MNIFRTMLRVAHLDRAEAFYTELLGTAGRRVGGGRIYFDCGPVILALLDADAVSPGPDDLYFAVDDVDAVHARAAALGCLSRADVHGAPAGDVVRRPWGERSFYAEDPWGNGLCFVDAATTFTGR